MFAVSQRTQRTRFVLLVLIFFTVCSGQASPNAIGQSDLRVSALKYPNSAEEGRYPVRSWAWSTTNLSTGYTELIPYALSAPDQEDAGSCLYMSLTGLLEWWLARLSPQTSRDSEGPLDLSERWYMNAANDSRYLSGVRNWKTDSIFIANNAKEAPLNATYRFTKGWFTRDSQGRINKATSTTPAAEYNVNYNWLDERHLATGPTASLPRFKRHILFADPQSNQWNVGVMPKGIVETVKEALRTQRAPVHILYNHFGYWHALMILGFDDDRDTRGCNFVESSRRYFKGEPTSSDQTLSDEEKQELLSRRTRFKEISDKLEKSYAENGGCNAKGMFYVRDSIYTDPSQPYIYDAFHPDGTGSYSKRIVMLEYAWLQHLTNHAVQPTLESAAP